MGRGGEKVNMGRGGRESEYGEGGLGLGSAVR